MYWDYESWGSAEPPENADEIIAYANDLIREYAENDHDDYETEEFSNELWEKYCAGKFPAELKGE